MADRSNTLWTRGINSNKFISCFVSYNANLKLNYNYALQSGNTVLYATVLTEKFILYDYFIRVFDCSIEFFNSVIKLNRH